jgi:hypothetical protein
MAAPDDVGHQEYGGGVHTEIMKGGPSDRKVGDGVRVCDR